jgi:hypothetical protein
MCTTHAEQVAGGRILPLRSNNHLRGWQRSCRQPQVRCASQPFGDPMTDWCIHHTLQTPAPRRYGACKGQTTPSHQRAGSDMSCQPAPAAHLLPEPHGLDDMKSDARPPMHNIRSNLIHLQHLVACRHGSTYTHILITDLPPPPALTPHRECGRPNRKAGLDRRIRPTQDQTNCCGGTRMGPRPGQIT